MRGRARAYSLAAYVAEHPQANEYTRDAARRVCAEVGTPAAREAHNRFQEVAFEDVVRVVLAEKP